MTTPQTKADDDTQKLLERLDNGAKWPGCAVPRLCADAARVIRQQSELIARYREDLWDALMQEAIVDGDMLDNLCLSTYEGLCATFAELGWLERVNGRMYRIVHGKERPNE